MFNLFKKLHKSASYRHDLSKYELAFTVKGIDYYCFKNDSEMPMGRYAIASTFYSELDMRMTRENLIQFTNEIEKWINKGRLDKVAILNNEIRERTNLITETNTLYRLASAVYFDLSEDLTTYDLKHNNKKISDWMEDGRMGFFYRQPMSRYINFQLISETDLATYLEIAKGRIESSKLILSEFSYKDE